MLSILIIDDTPEKIENIKDILKNSKISNPRLDIATCVVQAEQLMHERQYDLVLLDFYIPMNWEDKDPNPKNALNLLNDIEKEEDLYSPVRLLAITKAKEVAEEYRKLLYSNNCQLLSYSEESETWRSQLIKELNILAKIKQKLVYRKDFGCDVAVVTALQTPENDWLRKVINSDWNEVKIPGDDGTTYWHTFIESSKGRKIRIVTAFQNQMASTASSMLTTKIIYNFRPRYLFMTGIAAAVKEVGIGYGDVLVATEVWDAANGKLKEGNNGNHLFMPDYRHKVLDADFDNIISKLNMETKLLFDISESYPSDTGRPDTKLKIHKGPMASVPAVIACSDVIQAMEMHDRKLLGIEMEAYGMFYAAHNSIKPRPQYVASLKSVSDYATKEKNDAYQEYAAYTSAAVLKHIIVNYLTFE